MKRWIKRIVLLAAVGVLFFWFVQDRLDRLYAAEQKASGSGATVENNGRIDVEKLANENRVQRVVEHELFFLLAGVDENEEKGQGGVRSDTMMLFKADFDKGTIDLLSLPRDSRVYVEDQYTKLNHAHAYGGMDLTIQTIRDWLGVDLDYFVEVDYQGVKDIVNAMGGVEYTVPEEVEAYGYTTAEGEERVMRPGKQVLDGEAALSYLRHRNSYSSGDLGRVEAQQAFLKTVVKQLLSSDAISHLPALIKTYFQHVRTNIPWTDIAGMLPQLNQFTDAELTTHTIPGVGEYIGDVSYFLVDAEKTEALVRELFPNYLLRNRAELPPDWELLEMNDTSFDTPLEEKPDTEYDTPEYEESNDFEGMNVEPESFDAEAMQGQEIQGDSGEGE